jgi:tetratricopeptide (TPR) repeat protein
VLISAAFLPQPSPAQTSPESVARIKNLFDQHRWQEILQSVPGPVDDNADLNYYYGSAAAQLGRWEAARAAFLKGVQLKPQDERFPIELGGVAFRQKRYPEAARWLKRGLRLKPDDLYGNDFLATVYFLNANLEAALKYWNRIGKPHIANIRTDSLRVAPELLDRAITFAPTSMLSLQDFLATEERVGGLGIFSTYDFRMMLRSDGVFDVILAATERNGFGSGKVQAVASMFRGIFYETAYPEYFNIGHSAINLTSMVRWDSQNRRIQASLSEPLRGDPKYRLQFGTNLRNENWDVRDSTGALGALVSTLNMRREAVDAEFNSFNSGRWSWSTGAEFSHRDYRNVTAAASFAPVLLSGYQLKHFAQLNYTLLRIPERRFTGTTSLSSQTGTIWSYPAHSFEKLQAGILGRWLPQMTGDDYFTQAQIRYGKTFGQLPFDELYMLGLERDSDLGMRAHLGTDHGRKGNSPLGRNYVLMNGEIDKNIYSNSLVDFKLSPFLDIGKSTDSVPQLGSRRWLWDTGMQAKLRVWGIGFMLTYGRDVHTGKNAFYLSAGG